MNESHILRILQDFGIDINKEHLISLYAYAPVYRFNYADRNYVLKRTGIRSEPKAIAHWLDHLVSQGIKSVTPVKNFGQNPRCFSNGNDCAEENWVIYPFIKGISYTGNTNQINSAGKLLGQIHAVGMNTNFQLKANKTVIAIEPNKIEEEINTVLQKIEQYASTKLKDISEILSFYFLYYLENALPDILKINLHGFATQY